MSKFWDRLSVSLVAGVVLLIAWTLASAGCVDKPTPSLRSVMCVETEEGLSECCTELYPVGYSCWTE